MLEKPEIENEKIIHCLDAEYGLIVDQIDFLPIGADQNTAAYRVVTNDELVYYLKLRSGEFNEASVAVPNYLYKLGIKQIIPPLSAKTGELYACLESIRVILYPFVDGLNLSLIHI